MLKYTLAVSQMSNEIFKSVYKSYEEALSIQHRTHLKSTVMINMVFLSLEQSLCWGH